MTFPKNQIRREMERLFEAVNFHYHLNLESWFCKLSWNMSKKRGLCQTKEHLLPLHGWNPTHPATSHQRQWHGQARNCDKDVILNVYSCCVLFHYHCSDLAVVFEFKIYAMYVRFCLSQIVLSWFLNFVAEPGVFLQKHSCFANARDLSKAFMSLGFRTCAALGIPMDRHEVNGKATWIFSTYRFFAAHPRLIDLSFIDLVSRKSEIYGELLIIKLPMEVYIFKNLKTDFLKNENTHPIHMILLHQWLTEVFWTFASRPHNALPIWMYNDRLDTSVERGWVSLPLEVQHPCVLPLAIQEEYCVAFLQKGPPEPILVSGLRQGIFLTKLQLDKLQGFLKFKLPGKKQGSGKNGSLLKKDFAQALLDHVFPTADVSAKAEMLQAIMGKNWKHLQRESVHRHSKDILRAWHALDTEDKPEFAKIAEVATDEIALNEKREQADRSKSEKPKSAVEHATPGILRKLFPNVQACRVSRHPALKRYQAFYTAMETGDDGQPVPGQKR